MNKEIDVTPAKLEANRLNAQKSTGPRTPEGKTASKMNALKHGILANSVLVHAYKFRESTNEFKQLCQDFYRSLAPVGPLEETLIDRIIMVVWRQRRLRIAESAEIAKAINDAQSPEEPDHREMLFLLSQNNPDMPALPDTVQSCRKLCEALNIVRDSIERDCMLEAAEVEKYYKAVGRTYAHLIDDVIDAQSKLAEDPESRKLVGSGTLKECLKQKLLAILQGKIHEAESRLKNQLELQSAEQKAKRGSALLPSPEALDKIVRYEAGLERQLYRALNQLERLQRIRQGETVPAPVSIIT